VSVDIEPFGQSSAAAATQIAYDYAILTVTYEESPSTTRDFIRLIVDEEIQPATEFLTVPNRRLYWDNGQADQLETDEAPGVLISSYSWTVTIKRLPRLPNKATLFDLVGRSNAAGMYSVLQDVVQTYAAETVLYGAPSIRSYRDYLGRTIYDLTLNFMVRPGGWNKFYKAGTLTPARIYDDGGAIVYPYPTAALDNLQVITVEEA